MPATTPHLALPYPLNTDPANVPNDMHNLALALDKAALVDAGALGSRPAAGTLGKLYLDTATQLLWFDTGTTWIALNAATLPPTATLLMTASSSVPAGYLLCDGSAVSRATYSALFAALGTLYGAGNGTTTFNLPDYRDQVLYGANGSSSTALAQRLGAASHTHTVPDHTHTVPDHAHWMPDHTHNGVDHLHGVNILSGIPDAASANFANASTFNAAGRNSHVGVVGSTGAADRGLQTSGRVEGAQATQGSGNFSSWGSGVLTSGSGSTLQPGVGVNVLIKT